MNKRKVRPGYDGRAVANFILDHCDKLERRVTPLSLQKIIYFCHVWSLVLHKKPLIRHQFEAWDNGPVLQYVYREFKSLGRNVIESRATRLDPDSGQSEKVPYHFDDDTRSMLEKVVKYYSSKSAWKLVQESHVEGGPWCKVWNHDGSVNPGMKIDEETIQSFYSRTTIPFLTQ